MAGPRTSVDGFVIVTRYCVGRWRNGVRLELSTGAALSTGFLFALVDGRRCSQRPGKISGMTDENAVYRSSALLRGMTDPELRRARRNGQLVNVAAGAYVSRERSLELDAVGLHRVRIAAALHAHGGDVVVSHTSAAVLHGWDLGNADLDRVHLTRNRRTGGRCALSLHVHAAPLEVADVVMVDSVAVTSPARTVADLARSLPFDQAVVIGDGALHRAGISGEEIAMVLGRSGNRTGVGSARRVVGFLDGRSESPGESLSRIRMQELGMPAPDLQRVVLTAAGRFVARTDFFWDRGGVVGEFDGLGKYRAEPGRAGDIVEKEKLREDALRDTGLEVIRWVWADLRQFAVVKARFERACAWSRRE